MSKPVVVSYMRFSSKGQKLGNSEHRQEAGFDEFVAASGLKVARQYWDRGESAFTGRHRDGDYGQMLADCENRVYPAGSIVWIEDMDRFSRQRLHTVLGDWETVTSAGYVIRVGSLGQSFDANTDQMTLMGVILKSILAHEESQKKSSRGKANWKAKREAGAAAVNTKNRAGSKSAACPRWLTPAGAAYIPNDFALVVKEMFRLSLDGHGAKTIQGILKTDADVLNTLRNRRVIGEYQPTTRADKNDRKIEGAAVAGYYPAIVDEDTFFKVQAALDGRRKQRGRKGKYVTNLFKELFYGDDGEKMVIRVQRYGRSLTRKTPGSFRSWSYPAIESAILLELRDVNLSPAGADSKDYNAILQDLQRRIDEVTAIQSEYPSRANAVALANLEKKADEVTAEMEMEKGRVAPPVALSECQTLLGMLSGVQGDELLDVRTRISSCIARLISRVDVEIRESIHGTTEAIIGLTFVDGTRRGCRIENVGAKNIYTSLCAADGSPVGVDCLATATVGDAAVEVWGL